MNGYKWENAAASVSCNVVLKMNRTRTVCLDDLLMVSELNVCLTCMGHGGYVTVAALFAYQTFQLSLLLSIPPSAIHIDLSSSYPVLNLSTWYFS